MFIEVNMANQSLRNVHKGYIGNVTLDFSQALALLILHCHNAANKVKLQNAHSVWNKTMFK